MTPVDDAVRARMKRASRELGIVLTSVAADVTARIDKRCPYRARGDRCTFTGGCRNQRREAGAGGVTLRCAGDHELLRHVP